jgi:16S rRNA C967 or C1407 C5-methylase (RsmB/RsmF family)
MAYRNTQKLIYAIEVHKNRVQQLRSQRSEINLQGLSVPARSCQNLEGFLVEKVF